MMIGCNCKIALRARRLLRTSTLAIQLHHVMSIIMFNQLIGWFASVGSVCVLGDCSIQARWRFCRTAALLVVMPLRIMAA
jgi:hypothetical protein